MNTKIYSFLAAAGVALALGSCSDNPDYPLGKDDATGSVRLSDMGVEVSTDEMLMSRADDSGIDTSSFLVKITDAAGTSVYESTVATANEVVTLPVAEGYRLSVRSHEVENAAWEAPYYFGEQAFDIKADAITEVGTVSCKFANIRVSVRYTDELQALMGNDVTVAVKCSENGSSLEFAKNETRSGYFKALEGSTTLAAEFTGTVSGQTARLVKALNDVKAGQHRVITFGVKTGNTDVPDEFGSITVDGEGSGVKIADGLYLTAEVTTQTVDGNVTADETGDGDAKRPGQEDPVGPDNPDNPDEPKDDAIIIEAPGLSFTEVMKPTEVTDGKLLIKASKGVNNLFVEIVPGGKEFEDVLLALPMPLKFDLAHTASQDEKEKMQGFNFPVDDEIVGHTEVEFDLTQFIPLLDIYAGEPKFVLTVHDTEGNTLTKTLSFKVVK